MDNDLDFDNYTDEAEEKPTKAKKSPGPNIKRRKKGPQAPRWLTVSFWTWAAHGGITVLTGLGSLVFLGVINWVRNITKDEILYDRELQKIMDIFDALQASIDRTWLAAIIVGMVSIIAAWNARHGKKLWLHILSVLAVLHLIALIPWAAYESWLLNDALSGFNELAQQDDNPFSQWQNSEWQHIANSIVHMLLYIAMFVYLIILLIKTNNAAYSDACRTYREQRLAMKKSP